jgi:hypothetical protein
MSEQHLPWQTRLFLGGSSAAPTEVAAAVAAFSALGAQWERQRRPAPGGRAPRSAVRSPSTSATPRSVRWSDAPPSPSPALRLDLSSLLALPTPARAPPPPPPLLQAGRTEHARPTLIASGAAELPRERSPSTTRSPLEALTDVLRESDAVAWSPPKLSGLLAALRALNSAAEEAALSSKAANVQAAEPAEAKARQPSATPLTQRQAAEPRGGVGAALSTPSVHAGPPRILALSVRPPTASVAEQERAAARKSTDARRQAVFGLFIRSPRPSRA